MHGPLSTWPAGAGVTSLANAVQQTRLCTTRSNSAADFPASVNVALPWHRMLTCVRPLGMQGSGNLEPWYKRYGSILYASQPVRRGQGRGFPWPWYVDAKGFATHAAGSAIGECF
ncbi:hypothetical protein BDV95DRAFT_596590 [Massariosphaeria phaeospora]|uniref:Uncharacterized protein n=1 Tax=Massariosphaeria phaeospora TaxID=100035 RepID=A0A7C8I5U2_9PLEO|nr:hypothetical protein BDV95DRAFT_596590 [Massariosphaeria phaeospora]